MSSSISQSFKPLSLIKYTLPSIIMMVFMAIYTIADGILVSRYLGDSTLSALNIAYPVIFIVNGIGIMLGTGGTAIIGKTLGEGKTKEARSHLTFFVVSGVVIGILIMAITLLFQTPIARALGATDSLLPICKSYMLTCILFAPITVLQLMFQCYFSAAGKPNYSLILTIVGGVLNVVLDIFFLGNLHMGVEGAALATGLGQSILGIFGLCYFAFSKNELCFSNFKPDLIALGQACFNGSSEMVSNLANAVVTLLFNLIMMKLAGEAGVAAITIILYGQFLFNSLHLGFTIGVGPTISYNFGAKNDKELQNLVKICLTFVAGISIVLAMLAFLSSDVIVGIFVDRSSTTYSLAASGFAVFSINYLFGGLNIFVSSLFTALSDGKHSAILSFSRTFFWMVVCLLLLPELFGITGVWLAVPIAELMTLFLSVFFLVRKNKSYHYLG